jgi:hypothetical protein
MSAFVLHGQCVVTTTIALLVILLAEALNADPKQPLVGEIVPLVSVKNPE